MDTEILEFIKRRFRSSDRWLEGNCYYFAKILEARFGLEIVYCPIPGHFMARDKNSGLFYDWLGHHTEDEVVPYYVWNELETAEPRLYRSIVEDCVM